VFLPTECVNMRDTICRINRPTKHWYVRIIQQTVERGDGNHVSKQGTVQYNKLFVRSDDSIQNTKQS
jgi:hypothetical protein